MNRMIKNSPIYHIFSLIILLLAFLTGCNGFVPRLSDANDIVSFLLPEQTATATIDTVTHT